MSTKGEKSSNQENYEIDTLTNDRLLSNHEYDGIRELDNDLPPWWKWLFYITIAFGVIYLIRLFVFEADDLIQEKEYAKEMARAAAMTPKENKETFELRLLTDPAALQSGKETYDKICAVCHLKDGGGLVGPNLTDDYWIHGNTIEDMWEVVKTGVPEKGMIAYKDQLSKQQRLEVISYIISLHGTTPEKPKDPEGEKMEWIY